MSQRRLDVCTVIILAQTCTKTLLLLSVIFPRSLFWNPWLYTYNNWKPACGMATKGRSVFIKLIYLFCIPEYEIFHLR
jgi:hypothetical protein